MYPATLTSKGQITIPVSVRRVLGLNTGDKIDFVLSRDRIEVLKLGKVSDFYGSIKVEGAQDFRRIRESVKKKVAKRIVDENK